MLLISSLHVHPAEAYAESTCAECVHHVCHGHLSQQASGMHMCVLCQILTLTYIATAAGPLLCYLYKGKATYAPFRQTPCLTYYGLISLRAPPTV